MPDLTAVNETTDINLFEAGESVVWSLAGTFTGSAVLERTINAISGPWQVVQTLSSAASSTFVNEGYSRWYRVRVTAIGEEETITATMTEGTAQVANEWADTEGVPRLKVVDGGVEVEGTLSATGTISGSFSGTHTGNALLASTVFSTVEMTASANIPSTASFVTLNNASAKIAATALTPTRGAIRIIQQIDAGTQGHTVTTAGTFDGTNNTATFNAANETLVILGLSSTRWAIILNLGDVGLTNV